MVTQLHLALVLAIRARLLVLDEPTLGLDLLVRRRFYDTLLNDYMDEERTILVTTHQVEEIEQLLTDVLFIEQGRIVLDTPVDLIGERYSQLHRQTGPAGRGACAEAFQRARRAGTPCAFLRERVARTARVIGRPRYPNHRRPVRRAHAAGGNDMNNNKYQTLVRRELWEHRALWMAPLVGAALWSAGLRDMAESPGSGASSVSTSRAGVRRAQSQIGAASLLIIARRSSACSRQHRDVHLPARLPVRRAQGPQHPVLEVAAGLGRGNRARRSWSLALALVPLFVLVLSVVLQPLLVAHHRACAGSAAAPLPRRVDGWAALTALPYLLVGLGSSRVLWYAPVAAYLMLASVLAKRSPIVYAIVPPVALGVAEQLLFDSRHVFAFVIERLAPQFAQPGVVLPDDGTINVPVDWGMLISQPRIVAGHWLRPPQWPMA